MGWFSDAFAFLDKGGPVMVPLITCSVVSLTVIIERYARLKAASADSSELMRSTENLVYNGQMDRAIKDCVAHGTPAGSVMAAGLKFGRGGVEQAQRAMEEQAIRETADLQARLSVLDTIITIAPLLGLLGTVTGMIRSFHVISSKEGMSAPTAITGGVAEALIATATGLAIAIVTLVCYNYLNERVKHCVEAMEIRGTQVTNVIADCQEQRNEIKPLSA